MTDAEIDEWIAHDKANWEKYRDENKCGQRWRQCESCEVKCSTCEQITINTFKGEIPCESRMIMGCEYETCMKWPHRGY